MVGPRTWEHDLVVVIGIAAQVTALLVVALLFTRRRKQPVTCWGRAVTSCSVAWLCVFLSGYWFFFFLRTAPPKPDLYASPGCLLLTVAVCFAGVLACPPLQRRFSPSLLALQLVGLPATLSYAWAYLWIPRGGP